MQDGGHLASYNGHFDIVGKGVHDFLIALNVTSVDILHSFLTNRRNVVKISVLTLPCPFTPHFRRVRGDPHHSNLVFLKLDEISFQASHQ